VTTPAPAPHRSTPASRPAAADAPALYPDIRRAALEVLATAKAQWWDPAEILRILLTEEVAGRDDPR